MLLYLYIDSVNFIFHTISILSFDSPSTVKFEPLQTE
jgi:hypothetical protein